MPVATTTGVIRGATVRKVVFRAYAVSIFVMVFCVNAPAPLFELFRRSNGLNAGGLSALYAVYAGVVVVTLPAFGHVSDQIGRRSLVALGLGLIAVGSVALTTPNSFLVLVVGRLLQGVGVASMAAPAAAALAELSGIRGESAAASTVAVALAIGGASAPLFSGVMTEAFHIYPTASLLVCGGVALIAAVTVSVLPEPRQLANTGPFFAGPSTIVRTAELIPGTGSRGGSPAATRVHRTAFRQACATAVVCFGAQTTFFTLSGPIFGSLIASRVMLVAGCAMSALMMASALGGALARRVSARTAIIGSMCLLAPGVCAFFELVGAVPLAALAPAVAAIGLGHGLGYAGALRLINETSHGERRAAYTSRFYMAVYVGGGVPVLGMGILSGMAGQSVASAAFCLVFALAAFGVLHSLRLSSSKENFIELDGKS